MCICIQRSYADLASTHVRLRRYDTTVEQEGEEGEEGSPPPPLPFTFPQQQQQQPTQQQPAAPRGRQTGKPGGGAGGNTQSGALPSPIAATAHSFTPLELPLLRPHEAQAHNQRAMFAVQALGRLAGEG